MSVNITIRSGDSRPFVADINRLPAEVEIARQGGSAASLVVALIMTLIAFQFIAAVSGGAIASIIVIIALILFAGIGWSWWKRRTQPHRIMFGQDGVTVIEQGSFRAFEWRIPYRAFEGVRLRQRVARSRSGKTRYEIIELKHSDDAKTLPLYVERTDDVPEDRWRAYAALFGVPAIREDRNDT